MAATTPYVYNHLLTYRSGADDHSTPLESLEWWDWLNAEGTTTFRFSSSQGHFTARRESKHSNYYWYAYRKHDGKLTKVYLGKSEELTEQRLCSIAQTIMERMLSIQETSTRDTLSRNSLLALKFAPPPIRPSLVARPRLLTRLHSAKQQALTLISAPAGSGKSSLLHMWYTTLSEANVPVVWISLDQKDNDASRFWSTFISAMQILFPFFRKDTVISSRASRFPDPEAMVAPLLYDINSIPQHFILILDDYHLIESESIQQAVLSLLDHLPTPMHLVIATRTDPPFPLTRLRAQGQLIEIRAKELCFTIEEAELFFRHVMQLDLSTSEIIDIIQRTEGWIAGLQLAALSLQSQPNRERFIHTFTGDHTYIVDYLTEEVLNRLPERIQRFLLSTSILNKFNSSLCKSLSGLPGAQAVLQDLERKNLFLIPLDEQRRWYRYHILFSDFLRHQLEQIHPESIPELHLKAAAWYEQHGYLEDAIQHFLAAPDFSEAARVIEQACEALLKRGEVITLLHWLEALPDEQIHARPYLSINYAGVLASIDKLDLAELHLGYAERAIREIESTQHTQITSSGYETELDIQELYAALAVVRASLAAFRGDVTQTIALSQQARTQLTADNVYFQSILSASLGVAYARNGNLAEAAQTFLEVASTSEIAHHTYLSLIATCVQALFLLEKGQLRQAQSLYQQILHQSDQRKEQQHVAISMACLGLGELYYYWNDLDSAENFLRRGMRLEQNWESLMPLVRGALFFARIKNVQDQAEEAFTMLQDIERHATIFHLPSIVIHVEAIRATLWLAQGRIEEAARWAQSCGLSPTDEINFLNEFPHLILTQVFLALGKFELATILLAHILECAEIEGRERGILAVLLVQALLYQQQSKTAQASNVLARAVLLAEAEGNIRVFVEKGRAMRDLLSISSAFWVKESALSPSTLKFVDALLTAFDQQYGTALDQPYGIPGPLAEHPSPINESVPASYLTEREQDVLRLLALGLSSQQIANELIISRSTVKWHLKQIYARLGVHNRLETIVRAKELHLL